MFSTDDPDLRRVGVRIGDHVLDAGVAAEHAGMESGACWTQPTLNDFLSRGPHAWAAARAWLTDVLTDPAHRDAVEPHLLPLAEVTMHLPFEVADYVDFYASEQHATNVGRIFRPDGAALTPNWKHLPIGYHGRAGTVVVSGTDIVRPSGQRKAPAEAAPVFGPSVRLDIEAELGFVVGGATDLGARVGVDEADDHLFGVVLLNDWSARDIQAWEYVPLGPFLGKSFAHQHLRLGAADGGAERGPGRRCPARTPSRCPTCAARPTARRTAWTSTARCGSTAPWSRSPHYADMYWSPTQMLAHLTRQRRQPAQRRPVRLGHDQRHATRAPAGRCSS